MSMSHEESKADSAHPADHQGEEIFNSDDSHDKDELNNSQKPSSHFEEITNAYKDFIQAIKNENYDQIKAFLDSYQDKYDFLNRVEPSTRQTPIFFAAVIKDQALCFEVIKMFLDRGANGAFKDELQQTALYYLARDGKTNSIELFANQGVKIDDADNYGQSPLYYAARDGRLDTARRLIELGADVNKTDHISQTALFYAAREGHYEMCKFLIEKAANVNQADNKRQTPLHWAKKFNRQDVILLLLENGAINTKDGKLSTKDKLNKKVSMNAGGNTPTSVHSAQSGMPTNGGAGKGSSASNAAAAAEDKLLKKRRREKDEAKVAYKLYYTDESGNTTEVTAADFEKFKQNYPDIAALLLNPDKIMENVMSGDDGEADSWEKNAKKILNTLWKVKGAYLFHQPVDPVKYQIDDYFDIVKKPMDFGTIKKRLSTNFYKKAQEFADDMRLVFYNCILYNGSESEVGRIGVSLQKEFDSLVQSTNLMTAQSQGQGSNQGGMTSSQGN